MIGKTLAHYTITSELGKGGMGEVYRATDTKLGRNVAIKVLPVALAEDRERLARFERETKLLASLNHPNIVHVYGSRARDSKTARRCTSSRASGPARSSPRWVRPIPMTKRSRSPGKSRRPTTRASRTACWRSR